MYKSISLFFTALILLNRTSCMSNADPEDNEKYEQRLNELKEYFQSNGMSIDHMLEDSRFEVYEGIGDRFKNSAERKTLNLEEYKGVLGFDAKKAQMASFIDENREQLRKRKKSMAFRSTL